MCNLEDLSRYMPHCIGVVREKREKQGDGYKATAAVQVGKESAQRRVCTTSSVLTTESLRGLSGLGTENKSTAQAGFYLLRRLEIRRRLGFGEGVKVFVLELVNLRCSYISRKMSGRQRWFCFFNLKDISERVEFTFLRKLLWIITKNCSIFESY